MNKTTAPNNKVVEGLLGEVNRLSKECRSIPVGMASWERMRCFQERVLPVMYQLNALNYSVEWDVDKQEYMLVELVKDERGWTHPTIRLRRLEP